MTRFQQAIAGGAALIFIVLAGSACSTQGSDLTATPSPEPTQPVVPTPATPTPDDLTRSAAPTPDATRQAMDALMEASVERQRAAVSEFVASGADPCSLDAVDSIGSYSRPFQDVESLANDVDLIVEGEFGDSTMTMPPPRTLAARVRSELSISEVLLGSPSDDAILIEAGARVLQSGEGFIRSIAQGFDQCSVDHVLLFLVEIEEGEYGIVSQGYVTFIHGVVDVGRSSNLFGEGGTVESLKKDIRRMAGD